MSAASSLLFDEPLPFMTPTLDLSMVWLSINDTDPAERWLRSRLESFMSNMQQETPVTAGAVFGV